MKLSAKSCSAHRRLSARDGFTLPEVLIASTIFVLMIGGIIIANLFGLRMFQMAQTKANVTKWSRLTMEKLQNEIHACNSAQLGTVSNGLFTGLLDGETQQCSGLLIYPSSSTNSYILYFVNAADQTLRRTTDQAGSTMILASAVTNALPFSAQDMDGNILTNNVNTRLIHVALEFYQPAYFMQRADYYRFETSVKQRVVP
jgi:prepilin-type N-terminal cleavage/methylation domain-containing protein